MHGIVILALGIFGGRGQLQAPPPLEKNDSPTSLVPSASPPLSDNDVVVLVMSARNHVERRKAIRETWARGHTGVFFMVEDKACGIPPSYRTTAYSCEAKGPVPFDVQTPYDTKVAGEDALLKDEAEAHSDLILLPMVDHYRALPRKLKEMYQWALGHTEAKWMVKVDDDAVARIPELETMLAKQDANKLVVMGHIRRGVGVPKSGKWAEPDFIGPTYPPFANGAQGHAVTRGVAKAVVAHDGFEYQGEGVSLGIWMDEMKKPVQWVHSPQHFVAHGDCNDKSKIVIGHNIPPAKMRACFPTLGSLHLSFIGRLGNQLFQYASTVGIADVHGMTACIRGGDLATYFDGVDTGCTVVSPKKHVSENKKYATHNAFEFDGDTVLNGYLQSFKYFAPNVRDTIRFKQPILNEASNYLEQYKSRTTVGIHVRHGDLLKYGYIQFPPNEYFLNVLSYFRTKYSNAQFVVASDDPTWCSKQSFFVADDVRVVTEKHKPVVDMAILAGCNHMVMTVGTFGFWGAFLGANAKGGEVVYYDSQFKMVHPTNKGNVVLEDYYPEGWVAMGGTKPSYWERHLPSNQVKNDWCPSKGSDGAVFVQSMYTDKALEHFTTCTQIQRVGGSGDGGKRICTDEIRPNDCVVYSLGSRLDFSFEIDVVKRLGCQVHTFDCTVGTPPASKIPTGVSFHPWCVGGKDEAKSISSDLGHQGELGQYYTLTTIREKLGHTSIDLLKMDIERHEFAVVATLKDDNAPHQIAFETHLHNAYGMWGRPVSEDEWATMWATLGGLGYRVFAHEPNPFCVCCCEFSLVRGTPTVEHDVNRRLFRIHGTRAGFRAVLRISGSTLQTSLFERAERGVVVAPYHTCTTGTYEATVKVLFDGETEWSPTSCYVRNHSLDKVRPIVWEVNDTSSCERDGWWENNHRIPFQTRRVVDVPKEYPKLRWVEKHHAVTEIPPNVCFAGDSQMRNNLNGITTCGGVQAQRTKTACAPHRYFQVRWASDVQDVDFSGCERIVLNFGQWYLGWPGGSMTTVHEFETILTKFLGSFEQRSKLIWMTTNPMPSIYENGHEDVCPPKDWRQPYAIQDYVHVEKRLMRRFNVPVWDTFYRLLDAYDLGFDQYHYTTPLTNAIIAPLQLLLVQAIVPTPYLLGLGDSTMTEHLFEFVFDQFGMAPSNPGYDALVHAVTRMPSASLEEFNTTVRVNTDTIQYNENNIRFYARNRHWQSNSPTQTIVNHFIGCGQPMKDGCGVDSLHKTLKQRTLQREISSATHIMVNYAEHECVKGKNTSKYKQGLRRALTTLLHQKHLSSSLFYVSSNNYHKPCIRAMDDVAEAICAEMTIPFINLRNEIQEWERFNGVLHDSHIGVIGKWIQTTRGTPVADHSLIQLLHTLIVKRLMNWPRSTPSTIDSPLPGGVARGAYGRVSGIT